MGFDTIDCDRFCETKETKFYFCHETFAKSAVIHLVSDT